MKILFRLLLIILLVSSQTFASNVFNHPSDAKTVMASIPQFDNINSCFTQTKTVPNSPAVLKSGGCFTFDKNKGVVFHTEYPVKMTTSYDRNEKVNRIINDVINKNYCSLEKNFNFYFSKSNIWELGLIPKSSHMKKYIKSLYISGKNNINVIEIRNVDSTVTRIVFKAG